LLNGLAHLKRIEMRFPEAAVLGGVAQIPAELTEDGAVLHKGKLAGMLVGPRPGQQASASIAETFVEMATGSGISAKLSKNPMQDLWDKWIYLCTLAAATTLCRADIGAILQSDNGAMLLNGLLDECTAVAAAEGFPPAEAKMQGYREQLSDPKSRWSASMRVDLERGNPTEADHILGEMIKRAESHNIECPALRLCYTPLQVYEAARSK
jgi:2-dehydropantoate 2-reductase